MLDLWLLLAVSYLGFVLRLESFILQRYAPTLIFFTAVVLLVQPLVFRLFNLYATYWRYASVGELQRLLKAVTAGTVLTAAIVFVVGAFLPVFQPPRSVPLIFYLLAVPALAMPRLALRTVARRGRSNGGAKGMKRVLIMGAGDAGEMTLREIQGSDHLHMQVVGFVDDDPLKCNIAIHGVRVLGGRADIPRLVRAHGIRQIIIAMPTAPGTEIREIVRICETAAVATKTIPGIYELLNGGVTVTQLRDVQIEDLLRREPVRTDTTAVAALLRGRRILLTGAGGSIGSELARQILRCCPAQLVLLGHGENSIFTIMRELQDHKSTTEILPVIADIRFCDDIHALFVRHRPEIVFHAAAHKHVPLMEANPAEAITNNVLGTRNLLDAAAATGVDCFVMISTDKAVNPTSVMGASKRIAEMLVYQRGKQLGKAYVAVRFGNVLGSSGSVLLTFREQIAAGGPLTVTHPQMSRYFMTIPEAVQLVLQATVLGDGGEVFVLDMGEPVRVLDLATDLIKLSGLDVGRDIRIVFSGIRPGEKLFEELFLESENYRRTSHNKIMVSSNGCNIVPHTLAQAVDTLIASARRHDRKAILQNLQSLVPEARLLVPPPDKQLPVGEWSFQRSSQVASFTS